MPIDLVFKGTPAQEDELAKHLYDLASGQEKVQARAADAAAIDPVVEKAPAKRSSRTASTVTTIAPYIAGPQAAAATKLLDVVASSAEGVLGAALEIAGRPKIGWRESTSRTSVKMLRGGPVTVTETEELAAQASGLDIALMAFAGAFGVWLLGAQVSSWGQAAQVAGGPFPNNPLLNAFFSGWG